MKPHSLLLIDKRSSAGQLDSNGSDQHQWGKENNCHNCPEHIHNTLHQHIRSIGQRDTSYINDCQSSQIFQIRAAGNDSVIIGNELGMHTGFLTYINNILQPVIILQSQGNTNLIHVVIRKYGRKLVNLTYYFHTFIFGSLRNPVIQNAAYHITPFRIFSDFINILLSCTGISHQKDMLDIISFFSNIAQRKTYALTHEYLQNNINSKEYCNHTSGEVRQLHRIEKHHDGKKPHGIGLDDIKNLILGLRRSLGCIHVKDIIQNQIPRYYNKQYREVNLPCQDTGTRLHLHNRSAKPQKPRQQIGYRNDQCIQKYKQSIKIFLIVLYQLYHLLTRFCTTKSIFYIISCKSTTLFSNHADYIAP